MRHVRISATDSFIFHKRWDCRLADDCKRRYCHWHRLLWTDCETAARTQEGSGRKVLELRDCPECMEDERCERLSA